MRILLAEDERPLARAIQKILELNHYAADAVHDGEDALRHLQSGNYDAAVLDIMMPKMDGLTVLRRIRQTGSRMPILLLTAKSEIDDKVTGLDSGADYYLTKPFDAKELLATIRVITRGQTQTDTKLRAGNVTLDRATFELSSPTGSFRLANRESRLMEFFMTNHGQIFSSQRLMEKIWGDDGEAEDSAVWVYVSYLRKKLDALRADVQIVPASDGGYALEDRNDT